jgi:LEA14-like dessication related protein
MSRSFCLLPVAFLLALSAGCASLEPIEPPGATVADLRITDVRLLETTAVMTVRIENANSFPLQLEGGSYELALGGATVGTGLDAGGIELPRLASITREVTVHLSNLALVREAVAATQAAGTDYRLRARLHLRHEGRSRTVLAVREGRLATPAGAPTPGAAGGMMHLAPVGAP